MKKSGVYVLLAVLLISLLFVVPLVLQAVSVSAQDVVPGLGPGEAPLVSEIDKGKEAYEKYANETTWQYLSREWKSILLKNKVVASIDTFLSGSVVSVAFKILFGMPYSLSFKFFVVVVLWLWLLFNFMKFTNLIRLPKGLGFLIALGGAVALAQIKVISIISEWLLKLLFEKKAWYVRLIIGVLVVGILVFVYYCSSAISKALKESRKKAKEEETEQRQEELKGYTDEVRKTYTGLG